MSNQSALNYINFIFLYFALDNCILNMKANVHLFAKHPGIDFTRDRKLGFVNLMRFIIAMKGKTLRKEIRKYFKKSKNIMSNSAFVQQRTKLNDKTFPYLLEIFNKTSADYDTRLYKGYKLLAVDGSDFNIAKNINSESYINGEGNIMHLNAICDILNNVFLKTYIEPKSKCDERKACLSMLSDMTFNEKTILIADRGYESYQFFATVGSIHNLDYLVCVKNSGTKIAKNLPMKELDIETTIELRITQTNEDKEAYRSGKAIWIAGPSKFGKDKKLVTWTLPSPYHLTLRVVRFEIAPGSYETIITSLNRCEFPIKTIKKMYHRRWQIETAFRWLKYALSTIHFHGKSEEFSIQEILARIIMYNFSMRIMMNTEIKDTSNCKHLYQINYTEGFDLSRDYWHSRGSPPWNTMKLLQETILPIRPDRKDIRKLKKKTFIPFIYRVA